MSATLKRRVTALATSIMVLLVAGVAFAAWTSTATGSGSAESLDHVDNFVGIVSTTAAADLYPGDTAELVVTVTNDQDYPVTVDAISAGVSNAAGDCAAESVTTAATTPGDTLAAGASDDFTLVATMKGGAAEACADKTFTIPVTATLSSK